MARTTAKELTEAFVSHINTLGYDPEELTVHLGLVHRTHQQTITKVCVAWLEHMASLPDNRIDGRNEASRDLAQKMLRSPEVKQDYGDKPSKYLPLI